MVWRGTGNSFTGRLVKCQTQYQHYHGQYGRQVQMSAGERQPEIQGISLAEDKGDGTRTLGLSQAGYYALLRYENVWWQKQRNLQVGTFSFRILVSTL